MGALGATGTMIMSTDASNSRIRVKTVARRCRNCPINDRARAFGLCALCCTVVVNGEGKLFVSLTPLDGDNGWQTTDAARLAPVPRELFIE